LVFGELTDAAVLILMVGGTFKTIVPAVTRFETAFDAEFNILEVFVVLMVDEEFKMTFSLLIKFGFDLLE